LKGCQERIWRLKKYLWVLWWFFSNKDHRQVLWKIVKVFLYKHPILFTTFLFSFIFLFFFSFHHFGIIFLEFTSSPDWFLFYLNYKSIWCIPWPEFHLWWSLLRELFWKELFIFVWLKKGAKDLNFFWIKKHGHISFQVIIALFSKRLTLKQD